MAVDDFVRVTVSVTGAASVTRQGFGTPLVAGYHTHFTDRVRIYASSTALDAMGTDGFLPNEPIYKAVATIVSQSPCPAQVAVGRRALPPVQTLSLTCTSIVVGDVYGVTVIKPDGTSHKVTYTVIADDTLTTIALAIGALLTALTGMTVTSAVGVVTIVPVGAGLLVDLIDWTRNFILFDATADPGLSTDLDAIRAYNGQGWYGLALDSNSTAEVEAAAAWAEATGVGGKFFAWNNSDAQDAGRDGPGSDVMSNLQSAAYRRDVGLYSGRQLLSYAGAAWLGLMLPYNPGFAAFGYKTLAGVLADNDTSLPEGEALVLNTMTASSPGPGGKNGNYYKTVAGVNVTFPGVTPSGEWADVVVFVDWLQVNCQADVFAFLVGLPKVPFTDFGIAAIGNVIKNRMKIGASPAYGGLDPAQPIVVTVPLVDTVDTADKVARNLPNVTASGKLSGAILTTSVLITLTE